MGGKAIQAGPDRRNYLLLRQGDNFRFGQREYFRFFGLRYSFEKKEDQPDARGTDHVDQEGT
jgi:hypothetical protein